MPILSLLVLTVSQIVDVDPLLWHLIHMPLALIIVTALAVLWFAEQSVENLKLAVAGLCFSTSVLLFVVTDLERAILLSSILAAGIFGASRSNTITAESNSLQQIFHWLLREQFHFY